jgi:hypothetical protein
MKSIAFYNTGILTHNRQKSNAKMSEGEERLGV